MKVIEAKGINDFKQADNLKIEVLKHLDLSVSAASTTTIVGKSGSGKSTLISIPLVSNLSLTDPYILGQDIDGVSEDFRTIEEVMVLYFNFIFSHT